MSREMDPPGVRVFADPATTRRMLDALFERHSLPRPVPVRTRTEWLARRPETRRRLWECLGLDPLPARLPLEPHVSGALERPGHRVERVYWQSWPGVYASGWLYRPRCLDGPAPGVLCPHGHWQGGAVHPVVQSRCIALALKGYVVLAVDSAHVYRYEVGVNPIGVMTWNNMRALDYLQSLAEVDGSRMGCVGASGGGQQTMYLMALDDRVRVAAGAAAGGGRARGGEGGAPPTERGGPGGGGTYYAEGAAFNPARIEGRAAGGAGKENPPPQISDLRGEPLAPPVAIEP